MSLLAAVRDLHAEIDCWLAQDAGVDLQPDESHDKAGMNACAYYLLLFAQFESIVNAEYEQSVGGLKDSKFMHRVNVLIAPDNAAVILDYYEVRCEIAHGRRTAGLPFGMDEACERFLEWTADYCAGP